MQEFLWKARDSTGKLLKGKMRANTEQEAVNLLRNGYGKVVSLRIKKANFWQVWEAKLSKKNRRLTVKQKIVFFKQLAVILNSGVPLLKGMELLKERMLLLEVFALTWKFLYVTACLWLVLCSAAVRLSPIWP